MVNKKSTKNNSINHLLSRFITISNEDQVFQKVDKLSVLSPHSRKHCYNKINQQHPNISEQTAKLTNSAKGINVKLPKQK